MALEIYTAMFLVIAEDPYGVMFTDTEELPFPKGFVDDITAMIEAGISPVEICSFVQAHAHAINWQEESGTGEDVWIGYGYVPFARSWRAIVDITLEYAKQATS